MSDTRDGRKKADYQKLSSAFMVVNRYVLVLWRLHLGWCMSICPPLLGRVLLISHTGRKSGIVRRTPVNYRVIDGSVWLLALPAAAWWRNLQVEPRTELHLPFRRRRGLVEEVPIDAEHLDKIRAVLASGGWIAATLDRFHARGASDAEVLDHVQGFHLLRVVDLEPIRAA